MAVKPDPKVESYPVTDPHAPEGERTISAVVARLVQSDALDALAKIEAAVAEKEAAPILGNDLPQPPTDADARLWKIVRAKVADVVELSRVLQGRGAFSVSDIDKTDEIIAILAEGRAA